MNLYEKLNRLDDSLVESKTIVKKKKLTESTEDAKKKLFDAAASVKCKLDDDTIEYAMYDVDDFIENELVYCGKLLLSECPDMLFWRYVSDENFGSYCAVYESDEEFADAYYQISHDRVYNITDEVNGDYDYDDDMDEMLTENHKEYEVYMDSEISEGEGSSEQDVLEDEWQLIRSDKTYDPEGLDINPADEVLCSGSEEKCREEFNKLVVKFKRKEKTENPPQLAKVYRYFIQIEKLTPDTLVVYYPQAQSKDIYRLRKINGYA